MGTLVTMETFLNRIFLKLERYLLTSCKAYKTQVAKNLTGFNPHLLYPKLEKKTLGFESTLSTLVPIHHSYQF